MPENIKQEFNRLFGTGQYFERTLMIAYTISRHFGNQAIVNGDIAGQVGKCSLHRDIKEQYASSKYFRCKLHNYSKESIDCLNSWKNEIIESKECVNLFDLFSIESRMGRWAAQENMIYNAMGQLYINFFNSRSIIYPWSCVLREERKELLLHKNLISMVDAKLLEIPFDGSTNIIEKLSKYNGMTYLLSSYAKYYVEKLLFQIKNKI